MPHVLVESQNPVDLEIEKHMGSRLSLSKRLRASASIRRSSHPSSLLTGIAPIASSFRRRQSLWEGQICTPSSHSAGQKSSYLALCVLGITRAHSQILSKWSPAAAPNGSITTWPGNYVVDSWQMRDGLPGQSVSSSVKTPDGYLWVGTSGGLVRFRWL